MTGKTPPSSVGRLVNDSYMPLHERNELTYSPHVKLAIDRALAVQPQDRIASMALFRQALQSEPQDILSLFDQAERNEPVDPNLAHTPMGVSLKPSSWKEQTTRRASIIVAALAVVALFTKFMVDPDVKPIEESMVTTEPSIVQAHEASTGSTPLNPELTNTLDASFQAVIEKADSPLRIEMEQTTLTIGEDLLHFQVQSPISGFVSVYVRTSDRSLMQLLPNARVPALAIEANTPLRLPPANEPIQAAGPAGENQFLVVVTEQPRNYDHLQFQDHYGFGLIQTNQNGSGLGLQALEGISTCVSTACKDRLAAAWFSVEEVD